MPWVESQSTGPCWHFSALPECSWTSIESLPAQELYSKVSSVLKTHALEQKYNNLLTLEFIKLTINPPLIHTHTHILLNINFLVIPFSSSTTGPYYGPLKPSFCCYQSLFIFFVSLSPFSAESNVFVHNFHFKGSYKFSSMQMSETLRGNNHLKPPLTHTNTPGGSILHRWHE